MTHTVYSKLNAVQEESRLNGLMTHGKLKIKLKIAKYI